MLIRLDNNNASRITFFTQFNYGFKNFYTNDFYNESTSNTAISFFSTQPTYARVNWGDGNVETLDFIKIKNQERYWFGIRTLNTEIQHPNTPNWNFGVDENDKSIIPYPNHHYSDDDITKDRKVVITFSNDSVYQFYTNLVEYNTFPILEIPSLTALQISNTRNINEIPFNRLSRLVNLQTLTISSLGSRVSVLPEDLFSLPNLRGLNMARVLDLSDIDSSNLRLIKNLTTLQTLTIPYDNVRLYIKEFNELPNLRMLNITNSESDANLYPIMSEVENINPSLTTFHLMYETSERTNWGEQISGYGLENLTLLSIYNSINIQLDVLPEYLKELRSWRNFTGTLSMVTQNRIDTFVNSFYNYVTSWSEITMSETATDGLRNQFYGLTLTMNGRITNTTDKTPTGEYQAPDGFVEGVSNGTPTTPMEMVYVLTKNYNQTWVFLVQTSARYLSNDNEVKSIVYSKNEPYITNIVEEIEIF